VRVPFTLYRTVLVFVFFCGEKIVTKIRAVFLFLLQILCVLEFTQGEFQNTSKNRRLALYCTLLTQKFLKGELLDEAQMLAVKENQPLAP